MWFRSKAGVPFIIVASMAVVLAACSSSSKSSSTNTTASGTATTAAGSANTGGTTGSATGAGPTGTPIRIGYLEDETGGTAGIQTVGTATAQAWVNWTNAHGGIDGHPFKLYTANTNSDPAQATQEVNTFINSDHIVALWQNATSTETSWNPIVYKAGIPVIGGSCYFPEWTNQPNMYCTGTTIESGLYASEYVVKHAGYNKQALNQCNNVAACTSALPLAVLGAKSLGIDLFTSKSSSTAVDDTPECLADKNFGAQTVELGGLNVGPFVASCAAQNFKPVYVNEYDLFQLSEIASYPELEGAIGDDQGFPDFPSVSNVPQLSTYFQAMNKYASDYMVGGSKYGQHYANFSALSWSGAYVTGEGIANANVPANQPVTVADLERGLSMIPQGSTNGGYTPPVYYGNGTTTVEKAVNCFWLTKIVNGQYQLEGDLNSVTSQCEPLNLIADKGGQTVQPGGTAG